MLFFELYRQLDIRMFQTMAAVDPAYGSCAKYVFDKDSLVLLGTDHSIRLDVLAMKIEQDVPYKNWDIETEAILWFAEDSMEAALVRLINDAFRMWMAIDSNITEEYFINEINTVNSYLSSYDLRVFADKNGMSIFKDGTPFTFEQAIELIMEIDENRMDDAGIETLINEALFYRKMDKYEEAAVRLEKVARYVDHNQPIYTSTIFTLAETYYFMGNYERAVMLYYRVNMNHIADPDDFYMHLGHALLDAKMRKYDRHLRIYYRSLVDPEYADTHRQAVAASKGAVEEVFEEYEETCLEMGKKKYEEYRVTLPEDADDIDELLNIYEKPEEKPDVEHKILDGITLKEPTVQSGDLGKSVSESVAEALDLFLEGRYQDAFDIYFRLKGQVDTDSDYFTWIHFQLAKLYCFFDDPEKSGMALSQCNPNRFGLVYRQEDFLLLSRHVRIVRDDFESDPRYRVMVRGKMDSYFAQYDRTYNRFLKDKKLVKAYKQYEKECIEDERFDFGDQIRLADDKGKGFFSKIFGKKG